MFNALIDDLKIRNFADADTEAVVALWQICDLTRPWNDPYKDIIRKQSTLVNATGAGVNATGAGDVSNGAFWVGTINDDVIASVMIGYDGHRGSINYLAIDPKHAGQALGRHIMDQAEAFLIALGCPKIGFCVRRDNESVLAFYDKLGYGIDDVYSLGKRLIPDD